MYFYVVSASQFLLHNLFANYNYRLKEKEKNNLRHGCFISIRLGKKNKLIDFFFDILLIKQIECENRIRIRPMKIIKVRIYLFFKFYL